MADAEKLAAVLGLQPEDITRRMHPKVPDRPYPTVNWYGTPLERRFVEAEARRVPLDLASDERYGRSHWMIRPLMMRASSGAPIIKQCRNCGHKLGWTKAADLRCCERCESRLAGETVFEPFEGEQAVVSSLESLIHPDEDQRRRAIERLPAPFRSWEGGDVLTAVVELAIAAQNPDAAFNDPLGRCVSQGDFSCLTAESLAKGWAIVAGWPDTFSALVDRVSTPGAVRSMRWLQMMGPFARHLHRKAPDNPFRTLIRGALPEIVRALNLPVKRTDRSLFFSDPRTTAITTSDAVKAFRVSNETLARLVPRGKALLPSNSADRRLTLYDADVLGDAVKTLRESPQASDLVKALGAPNHVVKSLLTDGPLRFADNHDAQLLAGDDPVADLTSWQTFSDSLNSLPLKVESSEAISLMSALEREINPRVWSGVLKALSQGAMNAWKSEDGGPLLRRTYVLLEEFTGVAEPHRGRPLPDVRVSALAAAPLLWTSSPVVGAAEKAGLLTRRDGGFTLADLEAFRSRYVFPGEVRSWFSGTPLEFVKAMSSHGVRPAAALLRGNIWFRSDVRKLFAESASVEYHRY